MEKIRIVTMILDMIILIMLAVSAALLILNLMLKIKILRAMRHTANAIEETVKEEFNKANAEFRDRINLLSKENAKVREENEALKERLKNMGFKHFD